MKLRAVTVLALAAGLGMTGAVLAQDDVAKRTAGSREVVKNFGGRLVAALQGALKSGGPEAAIQVCKVEAPKIATEEGARTGWQVGRTALKVRNPNNAADAFEKRVLESFAARAAKGEPLANMEHTETVTENGKKVFRYMKAIPTGDVCVTCHGTDLAPTLAAKIKSLYPQDQATGFQVGQLRGAITIRQPM